MYITKIKLLLIIIITALVTSIISSCEIKTKEEQIQKRTGFNIEKLNYRIEKIEIDDKYICFTNTHTISCLHKER